jgi:hypothetical protein
LIIVPSPLAGLERQSLELRVMPDEPAWDQGIWPSSSDFQNYATAGQAGSGIELWFMTTTMPLRL